MGETFELVRFEKEEPAESAPPNPTLVSHEGFFTDIPGFENIAEGHSPKSLGSLSLARQGRYFYWGYSIDPELITDSARKTLINTIYYMHSMRNSITVDYACDTRQSLQVNLDLYRKVGYERGYGEGMRQSVLESSLQGYDESPKGLEAWLDNNLPFVFSGKSPKHRHEDGSYVRTVFEVDKDAKALKTPNSSRSSLEKWIELASNGTAEEKRLSTSCLERYVHPSIRPQGSDWAGWYANQKTRIAFIDSTGFWWQENPVVLEREASQKTDSPADKAATTLPE